MTLRIIGLEINDYKKIKAGFRVDPTGNLVIVDGKNDQGKTSVLDAIWAGLQWGSAGKEITMPIRKGETRASVVIELGDEDGNLKYTVTRKWTPSGSTLTISDPEGLVKYKTPQAFLDKLIGERSFDPKAFTRLKDKEQVEVLLSTVPDLPFKPAELAAKRKTAFDERTIVGREVTKLTGALANLTAPADDVPLEPINISSVLEKIEEIRLHNAGVQAQRDEANASYARVKETEQQIARLVEELAEQQRLHADQVEQTTAAFTTAKAAEFWSLDEANDELATIDQRNAAIQEARRHRDATDELARAKAEQDALSAQIKEIDKFKADALAKVEFPIPGLSFNEDGVIYNDMPLSAAGDAVQWRVSCALSMAANPELRMLRVTDGSLLDDDSLATLEELARGKDYQVWLEMVGDRGTDTSMSITIYDGEIVE